MPCSARPACRFSATACSSAAADPTIGTRLALLLADAGLAGTRSLGVQGYVAPDDVRRPAMLAGAVRSPAAQMEAAGIAKAAELGVETLQARPAADLQAARSLPMKVADVATGGGTDAAFAALHARGPVIEGLGLTGFGAHSNDAEYVDIATIAPRLYLVARLVMDVSAGGAW